MWMTEAEAIAALKKGNIAGLECLVRHYQVRAVRAAYLITRDLATAQEVVQEAFLRVYERIDQFDAQRPFAPWFFRIVTNDAIKAAKRGRRTVSLEQPGNDGEVSLWDILADERPDPAQQVTAGQLRAEIWKALDQLSPKQRAAVVLRYYLDMGEAEMTIKLNISPGTVKWHLYTARERLRTLLRSADEIL
jgi:RNA polymerase sigma-70 factor (ECF subfamily)